MKTLSKDSIIKYLDENNCIMSVEDNTLFVDGEEDYIAIHFRSEIEAYGPETGTHVTPKNMTDIMDAILMGDTWPRKIFLYVRYAPLLQVVGGQGFGWVDGTKLRMRV